MSKVFAENRNFENPYEDEYLSGILKYGEYLKTHPAKPPLPIDKASIEYYRNKSVAEIEKDLLVVFDGKIPKIPGIEDEDDDDDVQVVEDKVDDDDVQVVEDKVDDDDVQIIEKKSSEKPEEVENGN